MAALLYWIMILNNILEWSVVDPEKRKGCYSLVPRPIRLQLNARSTPRPGIDCTWAWLEFTQTSEFLKAKVFMLAS